MCISSRGTLVMYISSRDILCTLCIDISKLSHLGHMVYRRVSNLFDYSLHVLVPCDRHLDISMLSIHNCIAFYYLFIHIHSYHIMRFLVSSFFEMLSCDFSFSVFCLFHPRDKFTIAYESGSGTGRYNR